MTYKKYISSINLFTFLCFFYLALPVIIFLLGWTKLFIAIPASFVIIACCLRASSRSDKIVLPKIIQGDISKIIFIFLLIVVWVYLSGIGKFVFQNSDHIARNGMFEILVKHAWPVITSYTDESGATSTLGFTYYIGFWLPSALVGKLLGLRAGYLFQDIWAVLGIFLFYLLYCSYKKSYAYWPLLVFIFFSGLDYFGYRLLHWDTLELTQVLHLEWWCIDYQFSSITTQLFYVFNQCIPAWLATMLLLTQKRSKYLVFILGCCLLTSTLPFVGMIPIFLVILFSKMAKNNSLMMKDWLKDTFSFENVLGGGVCGIISFLYLKGNSAAQNIESPQAALSANSVTAMMDPRGILFVYLLFLLLEVGIYMLLIFRYKYNRVMYYVIGIIFLLCPLLRVGAEQDFCMRASIPALVILWIFVTDALSESYSKKQYPIFIALIITLCIGAITPIHEINRTIYETEKRYHSITQIPADTSPEDAFFTGYNFSADVTDSFFFKYLSK